MSDHQYIYIYNAARDIDSLLIQCFFVLNAFKKNMCFRLL